MLMLDFSGQTAVVTGGLQGIGKAIADLLFEGGANVVAFLASPFSSYMTGQAINVTGGMTMH